MGKNFLSKPLRAQLENTVKAARVVAETAASAALDQLGVGEAKAPEYLTMEQRELRRHLRTHGRTVGDQVSRDDKTQSTIHLVREVAYEHWHRMLFARFLAENDLLLWEPGASVTLLECNEMVEHPATSLGAKSGWELAGKLAARMLPQIFKPSSPVFELTLAREHQRDLERLLAGLPPEVFKASDSLGWVYQFWQAKRKDEVNASEVKIGADELPAVTQLFTESYMVEFQLHNSLGAWWVTRFPGKACPVELNYLRRLEDGTPVAGRFEGWPNHLSEFKLLDPCCGSGHFLVAAFLMLVPIRMAAEGLSAADAVDAVLGQNLFGLEIDPRCVEIAVFALALAAWTYHDENGLQLGVRAEMPAPNVACCGLPVAARVEQWQALVPKELPNAAQLRQEMRVLHRGLSQAPLLGSLLDPGRFLKVDLATPDIDLLRDLFIRGLAGERPSGGGEVSEEELRYITLGAQGLLEAARMLIRRYHLVVTNVPYLARGKQSNQLKEYCESHYPVAKNDLANVFLERCLELAKRGSEGVVQIVMPQNWLFSSGYKKQREASLRQVTWNLLVRLGEGGFDSPQAAGAFTILLTQTRIPPSRRAELRGIDASEPRGAEQKADLLRSGALVALNQFAQLDNPDARIALEDIGSGTLLSAYADSYLGLGTGDFSRFGRNFWEFPGPCPSGWSYLQASPVSHGPFEGLSYLVAWDDEEMRVRDMDALYRARIHNQDQSGQRAWGRRGVAVALMRDLKASLYQGHRYDKSLAVLVPKSEELLPAIWAYCSSCEFHDAVRQMDQAVIVANGTLVKVPFDLSKWQEVASERYAGGLPEPYSTDPTQWIFHGHPKSSTSPLQIAVALLLGYSWPAQRDGKMNLSQEARALVEAGRELGSHADDDGIVCLNAVRGEKPAHERLLALLIEAWESVEPGSWKSSTLDQILAEADATGKSLEVWLREKFFEQHAKLFHHRPFIWHIWDGLKDGFGALVNYHKLDAKNLERLVHTYLGDWIRTQEAGVASGVDGAQQRLVAALDLKRKLELIREGEVPYDIFVRWKPIEEQPLGWDPDLDDGIRLNIRPFMASEVLRHNKAPKLNIKLERDPGKDVESAPWFTARGGERRNDHHLTLAEKRAARESKK